MHYMIGTMQQLREFRERFGETIPDKVWKVIAEQVAILNTHYGADRDIKTDMGGYCIIFPTYNLYGLAEHKEVLSQYHLPYGEWEYQEKIIENKSAVEWVQELYLVDSDYGIVFFYPIPERKTHEDK